MPKIIKDYKDFLTKTDAVLIGKTRKTKSGDAFFTEIFYSRYGNGLYVQTPPLNVADDMEHHKFNLRVLGQKSSGFYELQVNMDKEIETRIPGIIKTEFDLNGTKGLDQNFFRTVKVNDADSLYQPHGDKVIRQDSLLGKSLGKTSLEDSLLGKGLGKTSLMEINDTYDFVMRVRPTTEIYNISKEKVPVSSLKRDFRVIAILHLSGLWIRENYSFEDLSKTTIGCKLEAEEAFLALAQTDTQKAPKAMKQKISIKRKTPVWEYGLQWNAVQILVQEPLGLESGSLLNDPELFRSFISHSSLASGRGYSAPSRLAPAAPPPPPPPPPPPNFHKPKKNIAEIIASNKGASKEILEKIQRQSGRKGPKPPSLKEILQRKSGLRKMPTDYSLTNVAKPRDLTVAEKLLNELQMRLRNKQSGSLCSPPSVSISTVDTLQESTTTVDPLQESATTVDSLQESATTINAIQESATTVDSLQKSANTVKGVHDCTVQNDNAPNKSNHNKTKNNKQSNHQKRGRKTSHPLRINRKYF